MKCEGRSCLSQEPAEDAAVRRGFLFVRQPRASGGRPRPVMEKPVNWPALIAEVLVAALLAYIRSEHRPKDEDPKG